MTEKESRITPLMTPRVFLNRVNKIIHCEQVPAGEEGLAYWLDVKNYVDQHIKVCKRRALTVEDILNEVHWDFELEEMRSGLRMESRLVILMYQSDLDDNMAELNKLPVAPFANIWLKDVLAIVNDDGTTLSESEYVRLCLRGCAAINKVNLYDLLVHDEILQHHKENVPLLHAISASGVRRQNQRKDLRLNIRFYHQFPQSYFFDLSHANAYLKEYWPHLTIKRVERDRVNLQLIDVISGRDVGKELLDLEEQENLLHHHLGIAVSRFNDVGKQTDPGKENQALQTKLAEAEARVTQYRNELTEAIDNECYEGSTTLVREWQKALIERNECNAVLQAVIERQKKSRP
jgi:hypothetical protein